MPDSVEINTPRLVLRELSINDLDSMSQLCLDPEITKYMDYIECNNVDEVRTWLEDKIMHNQSNPRFSYGFAIVEKATTNMVGWIGIGKAETPDKGDMDFGYAMHKNYWGKGYASEALKGLLDFCFANLDVHKITGKCDENNIGSIKVMQKAGMTFEKSIKEEDGSVTQRFSTVK